MANLQGTSRPPPPRGRAGRDFLSLCIGAALGAGILVLTLMVSGRTDPAPKPAVTVSRPPDAPMTERPRLRSEWRSHERRSEPRVGASPSDEVDSTDDESASAVETAVTPHAAMADAIREHESIPRDARWAGVAEATLSGVIQKADGEHLLRNIDCRRTTCVATLEWPNHEKAREQYVYLMQAAYEPNCGISLLVRDDTGVADVHFDCDESREN